MLTITDASFANETEIDSQGREKRHRSQKAIVNALCSPDILNGTEADLHIIHWQSVTDKRVCTSTLQAEAHAMMSGTDLGDRFRAIIAN